MSNANSRTDNCTSAVPLANSPLNMLERRALVFAPLLCYQGVFVECDRFLQTKLPSASKNHRARGSNSIANWIAQNGDLLNQSRAVFLASTRRLNGLGLEKRLKFRDSKRCSW